MRYQKIYNRARNVWMVWRIVGTSSEVVKTFKTEQAADRWIAKQG